MSKVKEIEKCIRKQRRESEGFPLWENSRDLQSLQVKGLRQPELISISLVVVKSWGIPIPRGHKSSCHKAYLILISCEYKSLNIFRFKNPALQGL